MNPIGQKPALTRAGRRWLAKACQGGSRAALARWRAALARATWACAMLACATPAMPPPTPPLAAAAERHCSIGPEAPPTRVPAQIAPAERVPDFLLATEACEVLDSRELVGRVPFVVVFFASWCSVCEHRIPLLREALQRRQGQIKPLWVTLDDATDGWRATHEFLERHALTPTNAVPGRDFLGFSLGYNPFRSVPVVVIVGRSGRVVTVQIGVREGDDVELEQALDDAIDEAPERSLFTSFPRP
jgi:thiol-disulfide isomerase/thioredoxin